MAWALEAWGSKLWTFPAWHGFPSWGKMVDRATGRTGLWPGIHTQGHDGGGSERSPDLRTGVEGGAPHRPSPDPAEDAGRKGPGPGPRCPRASVCPSAKWDRSPERPGLLTRG
ncbi:myosin light chain kinase 3-like isoform X2 [Felis catus]|uniref:myosin light chain kinase 3-like isoform X2 n=1 Tax=Felis catus TaxID=9685 RepID=UPI001D1A1FFE|nr:myosin light chain kinase 3-like isoform X2 [Felis catus]